MWAEAVRDCLYGMGRPFVSVCECPGELAQGQSPSLLLIRVLSSMDCRVILTGLENVVNISVKSCSSS